MKASVGLCVSGVQGLIHAHVVIGLSRLLSHWLSAVGCSQVLKPPAHSDPLRDPLTSWQLTPSKQQEGLIPSLNGSHLVHSGPFRKISLIDSVPS